MRDYELALVVDPDLTGGNRKKQAEKIQKTIEALKGKVKKANEWGEKKLAYPIKDKNLGFYFLWEIKLPEKAKAELDKKLKLEKGLLRYLIIRR